VSRWGQIVVGTTNLKCSEQNHNPKEKGFKLKEYSRLKSHESLSESLADSKTGHHVRAGLAAYRRGRLGITLPAHYDSNGVPTAPRYAGIVSAVSIRVRLAPGPGAGHSAPA
jgi:hypothetical protein